MKKILLLIVAVLFATSLFAENVNQNKAKQVAKAFAAQRDRNAAQLKTDIVYSHPMPNKRDAAFYVVNIGDTGFVIVSANDVAHPVLAYSYNRPWPQGSELPSQVAGYLDDLANQIEYASSQTPDRGIKTEWQELLSIDPNNPPQPKGNRTQVGPLLTTTWDQGQYYNAMCPEDEDGQDGHAVTGCVATAMAQIINYKEYPVHGRGIHKYLSYENDYGILTVNFDESYYNYENMPDRLTSGSTQEEILSVAKLMYDCGVASSMQYGIGGSGAYCENLRAAFINHFDFPSTLGIADRHMYTEAEWVALLRNEIDEDSPVFYTGINALVGHAFVLDGYDEDDYFHINFGWSGDCDGWFLTSAINPNWEFNYWQEAIVGIRPNNASKVLLCNYRPEFDWSYATYDANNEYYTISSPLHLYNVSARNDYKMNYNDYGEYRPIILHFSPVDVSGQLILDVCDIEEGHAVVVYDGINLDSLICVLEPSGEGWPHANLPNDPQYQQYVTNNFSPIVSSRNGFTIMAYCEGLLENEFHLIVSDVSDCRMVSNIETVHESNGYRVNWTPNGTATQWQVVWNNNEAVCDTPTILIDNTLLNDNIEVKVRSVCGDENSSEWNTIILNEKKYWPDFVEEEPEGFIMNENTIIISSAEGLAWWVRQCGDALSQTELNKKTIVINADIDLGAHLWKPIVCYGKIKGNGHIINNLRTGYFNNGTGLFSRYIGDTISDLHIRNAVICGDGGIGTIAAFVDHAVVLNCSSDNYIIRSKGGAMGGLFGRTDYSRIINCSAIGENYGAAVNGGIVGWNMYSEYINCYSSQGSSFQWQSCNSDVFLPGLLTGVDYGGVYDNCYADIKNTKRLWDPEVDSLATLYYFFGFSGGHGIQIESAINVATFRIEDELLGRIIQDTAVNYTLGENMDLLTALNNKVVEENSSDMRLWVWNNELHFPVLGVYYEPTCPNVKNLTAKTIEIDDGFAVALSWTEQGSAEEWQVKYIVEDNPIIHSAYATNDTIIGLTLGKDYSFYVRPICHGADTVGWGQPIQLFVDKLYWSDVVTKRPEGYIEDSEGNVVISSTEGLAWLGKQGQSFEGKTIYIANDIDMGAYRWKPLGYFLGTLDGQNHTISNIICRESTSNEDAWGIGFVGTSQNTTVRNLTIKDGVFSGRMFVGSLFGMALGGYFDNCHIVNTNVIGSNCVGGLGGQIAGIGRNCVVINCSVSGSIYADQITGGLIGENSADGIVSNCYSNCNINSLGKMPLRGRGGLVAGHGGYIYNCYSAGNILFDDTEHYNTTGTCFGGMGTVGSIAEAQFVYARQSDGLYLLGKSDIWLTIPYLISDTSSFNNTGVLDAPVTIENTSYTNLLDALNAWVDANNANGEYLYWVADTENQNGGFPMLEQQPSAEYQIRQLASGWNWYSTYIEQNDADGLSMLESGLGSHGELIMSRTGAMVENFEGSFWWGDLNAVTNEEMYEIKTNAQTNVVMTGGKATPSSHPITVAPGWNWIGYVPNTSNSIDNALSSLTSNEDDIIQSRNAFSSYFPGYGWYGDLENMTPGQGYMYKSNGTVSQPLVYPTASRSNESEAVAYHNQANYNRYRNVMDVMAKVVINGEPANSNRYELAAFVDGECRGRAKLQYVEPIDTYLAFLTINGNDDETVTFSLYDEDMDVTYYASESNVVAFKANEVIGRFRSPYIVRFNNKETEETSLFTIYPNPVDKNTEFTIDIPTNEKIVEVITTNSFGSIIRDERALKGNVLKGLSQSGVYNIQIITDRGNNYRGRVIVK